MPFVLQARLGHWNRRRYLASRWVGPVLFSRPLFSSRSLLFQSLFSYSEKVYLAPSGVQKERIESEDIFVLTLKVRYKYFSLFLTKLTCLSIQDREFLRWPVHKPLKQSQCTPLFYNAYELRDCGACIHVRNFFYSPLRSLLSSPRLGSQ